jgi:hypothetical protein
MIVYGVFKRQYDKDAQLCEILVREEFVCAFIKSDDAEEYAADQNISYSRVVCRFEVKPIEVIE